jgi:hypothetical protein
VPVSSLRTAALLCVSDVVLCQGCRDAQDGGRPLPLYTAGAGITMEGWAACLMRLKGERVCLMA